MKIFIYNDRGSSNLATDYYVQSVCQALGCDEVVAVNSLREVDAGSWLFLYQSKDFTKAYFYPKKFRTIVWFQGVVPEEAYMTFRSVLRYLAWSIFELISLYRANLCLFVSESMRNHYRSKYVYTKNNYFIIPCVNRDFLKTSPTNYLPWIERPEHSYVYAGSMQKWQEPEEMLKYFLYVQNNISASASLSIFTEDLDQARNIVDSLNVRNVIISKKIGKDLDEALANHRYGFLFRRDGIVNHVATPTKMSTYLASGVLPLVTSSVGYFSLFYFGSKKLAINYSDLGDFKRVSEHIYYMSNVENFEKNFLNLLNSYFYGEDSFRGRLDAIPKAYLTMKE